MIMEKKKELVVSTLEKFVEMAKNVIEKII